MISRGPQQFPSINAGNCRRTSSDRINGIINIKPDSQSSKPGYHYLQVCAVAFDTWCPTRTRSPGHVYDLRYGATAGLWFTSTFVRCYGCRVTPFTARSGHLHHTFTHVDRYVVCYGSTVYLRTALLPVPALKTPRHVYYRLPHRHHCGRRYVHRFPLDCYVAYLPTYLRFASLFGRSHVYPDHAALILVGYGQFPFAVTVWNYYVVPLFVCSTSYYVYVSTVTHLVTDAYTVLPIVSRYNVYTVTYTIYIRFQDCCSLVGFYCS